MDKKQVIVIASEIDIVMARLRVRRFAQIVGLDTKDQASISLVVSSLAHAMELDGIDRGRVIIDRLDKDGRVGVRVVCAKEYGAVSGLAEKLKNAGWIADELTVEKLSPTGVRVTAIKWAGKRAQAGSPNLDHLELYQARDG
jgi:anti-sigma regulatory factor (Ser/Thr protein kinase)